MNINKYTRQLENLVVEMAKVAREYKKDYFIGGGLAIDVSLGKMSRNHHDIDFHPMLADAQWWIEWFEKRGLKVEKRDDERFPETWNVFDLSDEPIVDMWPFKLKNKDLLINYQGKYVDAGRRWEETMWVNYEGVKIRIENPSRVLEQKTRHVRQLGQKYRPCDVHDFKIMGREVEGVSNKI